MKTTIIERPANTLSKYYVANKAGIYRRRKENPEQYKQYNREYQRKRRADPVKYAEIKARCDLRSYLTGLHETSYKVISRLGVDRATLAGKHGYTEEAFKAMLKTHEVDHILSTSWFNKTNREHLKPYMYRHYNIQFVPKKTNRSKHSWVDEKDLRVQLIIKMMELDYEQATYSHDAAEVSKIHALNNDIMKLMRRIKKQYLTT